jgi:hypothetical protein
MTVLIDAKRLSAVVARQQRNPAKAARRRPDKWNDGLSNIRRSSDFSRVVDTRSGTIFAAAKVTKFVGRKLARFQMVDRVSPEGESPALPATSPKLLSRQGTRPAPESSATVYAVVSPNVSRKVTTPAVSTRITVTTLVLLILFLLNSRFMDAIYFGYGAVTVIVVVEQEPMYPAGRLCEVIA